MKPQTSAAATQYSRKGSGTEIDPLFPKSPLPMWVYDAGTLQFLDANDAAVEAFGYSRAELLTMALPDLLTEPSPGSPNSKPQSSRSRQASDAQIHVCRKDGSVLTLQVGTRGLDYQGHQAQVATMTEVRGSHEPGNSVATVFEAMPNPAVLVDPQGTIVLVNAQLEKRFGYSRDELLGQDVEVLLPKRYWTRHRAERAKLLANPRSRPMGAGLQLRASPKSGSEFPVDVSLAPLQMAGRSFVLAVVQDITEQRQAERALNEAESRYRDLVENTQVLMCTHDLDGNLIAINSWGAHVLGYEPSDLIGRNIQAYLAPDGRAAVPAYLHHIRRRGSADGIVHVMTASGQRRIWEFHNTLRMEDVAQPIVRGTAFDITERRQAEEALRESEAGYKLLFEATPVGIALSDMDGNILTFNSAILEPGGYTQEDVLAMGNVSSLYAEDAQRSEVLALLQKQGYVTKHPVKFRRKDGSSYHALLSLRKLEINGKKRLQALVEDLTAQREAEDALRKSETLYRELFNNALEGVFRTTPDGRFLSANPALVHMLGYESEEELLILSVRDLYVDPEHQVHNWEKILESGELRDFEIHLRRRDGEVLIVLENSRAIRDASGNIIHYEGTLTDITERKRMEEALRNSEAELRALFEAIPDLVMVLDRDGRYLKIVPGHADMLNAPGEELLGQRIHELLSQSKADEFVAHIHQVLRTRQPVQYEYALLIGSQIKWFSGAIAPLAKDSVVWVARDVTTQKQTDEQVQRRLMELEALYESGLALGKMLDPREISRKIIEVLNKRLNWHHATVCVRRGDTEDVELLAFSEATGLDRSTSDGTSRTNVAITKIGQGMAGWVMQHGRMINSPDLSSDPRYHEIFPNMRSGLYVPIWASGRVLGCISVESSQRDAFSDADERLLTTLASQAAAALENARLFSETQQRVSESLGLYEFTRDLAAQSDLPTLLNTLAERVGSLLNVAGGAVYLYDEQQQELEIVSTTDESLPLGTRLALGEGMAGKVAQTRQPSSVDDYQQWEGRPTQFAGKSWSAVVEVPMLYRGELIGVLAAYHLHGEESSTAGNAARFTEDDVRLLSMFGSSASGAIYSARLFEQVSRRAGEFEVLYQTSADISSQTELHTLLNTVIQRARDLMDAAGASLYLYDSQAGDLELAAANDPNLRVGSHVALGEGVSGAVALSKQPLTIRDYRTWEGRSAQFEDLALTSVVCVPMLYSGQLIGVLNVFHKADQVQSDETKAFTPQDASLLELLANAAAGAVYVARLLEQTRRRVEQLSALHAVDTAIGSTTDLRVSLQAVLESVLRQLRVDAADVLLLNPSTLTLQYSAGSGFFTTEINRSASSIGVGLAGKVALERRMIQIPDLESADPGLTRPRLVVAEHFRAYVGMPLIAKGEVKGVLELFQRNPLEFDEEQKSLLEVLAGQAALAIDNAQLYEGLEKANLELTMAYDATIEGWSQALELRDQETQGHSSRVLELTLRLAGAMGLSDRQLRDMRRGVLLHDIGKMGIPDAILHKPGPLTAEEWQIMHQHPQYAYDMLAPIVYLRNSLEIPYAHHEKWDGSGYPRGLKADTIPLAARIFCVVDVYDALTSNRPYRGAWSESKALEYITEQSGKHFDPQVVEAFLRLLRG